MNEIEYRAIKARRYRDCITIDDIDEQWKWCVYMGLWETSGWISNDKDHQKHGRSPQYELLKIVIPNQRRFKK